ncbi:CBS domain-containing protein [Catenulispora sp. MAP12-49]|uniref:CBS domain-containing protein n=1 Tax=Catenulispora sp. MAP12-49 TaxID=3156302 RepID=UPI0035179948
MKHTAVSRLMTPADQVVTVLADAPFSAVAELLDRHHIGAVPVVHSDGRVLGVVSESDLVRKESACAVDPPGFGQRLLPGRARRKAEAEIAATTTRELMTSPALTIGPEAAVPAAARRMTEQHVRQLVVTDARGVLKGVVSRSDLLAAFVRADAEIRREVAEDIIRGVFWIDPATLRILVDDGVVLLGGRVETRGLARLIAEMVGRADGVAAVVDDLEYDRDGPRDRPPNAGQYELLDRPGS